MRILIVSALLMLAPGSAFSSSTNLGTVKTYSLDLNPHATSYQGETFNRHFAVTVSLSLSAESVASAKPYDSQQCQYRSNGDVEIAYGCVPACDSVVQFQLGSATLHVQDLDSRKSFDSAAEPLIVSATDTTLGGCNGAVPALTSQTTSPTNKSIYLSITLGGDQKLSVAVNELAAQFISTDQNLYSATQIAVSDKLQGQIYYQQESDWMISTSVLAGQLDNHTNF